MLYSFKFVNRQLHHRLPDFPEDYQISIKFSIVGRMAICLLARLTPHVGPRTILPFPLVCISIQVVELSLCVVLVVKALELFLLQQYCVFLFPTAAPNFKCQPSQEIEVKMISDCSWAWASVGAFQNCQPTLALGPPPIIFVRMRLEFDWLCL